jgi:chromosome segregation ATPase
MTIVGKILVFLVLVMSVVNGGLVIASYIARTKVVQDIEQERKYRQVEQATTSVLKTQKTEIEQEAQSKIEQLTKAVVRLQDDNASKDVVIRNLGTQIQDQEKKTLLAEASSKAAEEEVKKRKEDVEILRATLKKEMEENVKVVNKNNVLTNEATLAKIEAKASREQSQRLEQELERMAKDIAHMQSAPAKGATTVALKAANPPREAVEGLVKATDPATGLVQITLGSDAGLNVGHTLEVFRINTTNPDRSQYLGRIRIVEVKATEAIAAPVDKMANKIRVNDNVASRLTGG